MDNEYRILLEIKDDIVDAKHYKDITLSVRINGITVSSEKIVNKSIIKSDFDYFVDCMISEVKRRIRFMEKSDG